MRIKLFIIFLIFFIPSIAFSITRYVDTDCSNGIDTYDPGGDACTGGSDLSYDSIANCEAAMDGGDICSIRAGSYNERPTIDKSGSNGTPTTFQSYNSEAVDVNGFTITANWVLIYDLTIDWDGDNSGNPAIDVQGEDVTIDSCTLTDSNNLITHSWALDKDRLTVSNCDLSVFGGGIKIGGGDGHIIKNNTFHDQEPDTFAGAGDGIFLQASSGAAITNILISGNKFYNWTQQGTSEHADAIQLVTQSGGICESNECTGAIIEYNYFDQREDPYGEGDQITAIMLDGDYHGIIIRYNIFKANLGINAGGQVLTSAYVYNNTFVGDLNFSASYAGGLNADALHTGWYVHNNISADNLDKSLYLSGSGHDTGNNYEYTTDASNPSNSGVTVTVADPKFVTWADAGDVPGDYSLASDSPCINAGTDMGTTGNAEMGINPNFQYADWPGPTVLNQDDYGAWEIGAYVYVEAAPSGGPGTIAGGGSGTIAGGGTGTIEGTEP